MLTEKKLRAGHRFSDLGAFSERPVLLVFDDVFVFAKALEENTEFASTTVLRIVNKRRIGTNLNFQTRDRKGIAGRF